MSAKSSALVSVVPWYNPEEFKKVFECLFSKDLNKMKWAVETISVWESRCHPSLPNAVEATFLLIKAVIQDILWTNGIKVCDHADLQCLYGSAITRFVGLTVEVNKRKTTSTSAEVAKSIGIPMFIVQTRNESCHSYRPSLTNLRSAATNAIDYLKESYWKKKVRSVYHFAKQPPDEKELRKLFKAFMQFDENARFLSHDGKRKMNPEFIKILKNMESYLKQDEQHFVKVLVSKGIFIPHDKDFKAMVGDDAYAAFQNESFLDDRDEDDVKMDDEGESLCVESDLQIERSDLPDIPVQHESLWQHVFSLLSKYDAVPLFMELLLESQGNRTVVGQKLLISWIADILTLHTACGFTTSSTCLKKTLRRHGLVINWQRLFHSAVINPCKYTFIVLPLILEHIKKPKKFAVHISTLVSLKLGFGKFGSESTGQKIKYEKMFHTVGDLKQTLERQRNGGEKKSKKNIFSPCPDNCHREWPIGRILNRTNDEEEEEMQGIFESTSEQLIFDGFQSNENEDDDDEYDSAYNSEEPDMEKIRDELRKRKTLLLHLS